MIGNTVLVGLTGGIAAGKSLVASMFVELGAALVDADAIARDVVAPGCPALNAIVEEFGDAALLPDGQLNRAWLGERVFKNTEARKRLEAITHPAIVAESQRRFQRLVEQGAKVVIYDAALLIEAGRYRDMDLVIVVMADDAVRLERLKQRNGLNTDEAMNRIQSQMPQGEKVTYADFVIDNSGTIENTQRRVDEIWRAITTR